MCDQGLPTKGQGTIVLHVVVAALGTERHFIVSVDIFIMETAEKGMMKIIQGVQTNDLLERIKALIQEDTYAVCGLNT